MREGAWSTRTVVVCREMLFFFFLFFFTAVWGRVKAGKITGVINNLNYIIVIVHAGAPTETEPLLMSLVKPVPLLQ